MGEQSNIEREYNREDVNFEPWTSSTNEKRETLPEKEIAFAIIKPDFVEEKNEIIAEIEKYGLDVIYRIETYLTPDVVDHIYKDVKDKHFYETMKSYLTKKPVVILLVGGKGIDAQKVLSQLKTNDKGEDGIIRKKFQKDPFLSSEEIELWNKGEHPNQQEVTIQLTQKNVIHTADSTEEALNSLKLLLGDKFNELRIRGMLPSELWDFFKDDKSV